MFSIGDKILYPMHGAGIIHKIEDKDILGETRKYYMLKLPFGDMSVMIPVDNSNDIGIRPIIQAAEIDQVFSVLREVSSEMSGNWNKRQRDNMERLKTGDVMQVAAVVRDLIRFDRIKKLSTGEKKMLNNARQILESELVLAGEIELIKVDELVESAI